MIVLLNFIARADDHVRVHECEQAVLSLTQLQLWFQLLQHQHAALPEHHLLHWEFHFHESFVLPLSMLELSQLSVSPRIQLLLSFPLLKTVLKLFLKHWEIFFLLGSVFNFFLTTFLLFVCDDDSTASSFFLLFKTLESVVEVISALTEVLSTLSTSFCSSFFSRTSFRSDSESSQMNRALW